EAGDTLDGAVAEVQQPSVCEHEIDAEYRVAHDAVLRAEQSSGAGGDVAADGGDVAAGRIGCPPDAVLGELRVERRVHDARLHDGEEVVRTHLDESIHAGGREHDLSLAGVRGARQAGACASDHHGCARRGGDPHGALHVLDGAGVHDGERSCGGAVSAAVRAGGLESLRRSVDDLAELAPERLEHAHASERRPAMTPAATATTANPMPIPACPIDHQARVTPA